MDAWRRVAEQQAGLITRAQLNALGVRRWTVAQRVRTERWQQVSSRVVCTTTGELTREQRAWLGVLHAGDGALIGGLTTAEDLGLRGWQRDVTTVLVPYELGRPTPVEGIRFIRTRRDLAAMRLRRYGLPRCGLEAAVLLFAAQDRSERTAQGVLAACVQQGLTTPERLEEWVERLVPLRRSALFRRTLAEIAGGAQSLAEIDVARMCRRAGLRLPDRQVRRRDAHGRLRYTDCEWRLADGRTAVLEVDGLFHMDVEQWEDDIARQRALTTPSRLVVRCTTREVRECSEVVAADLRRLGVPLAA
ncbi:hypothetical protein [Nocardioides montaniterrae]